MKEYRVIGLVGASVELGIYKAKSKEDAIQQAYDNKEADFNPQLCWQCANEVEVGDVYDVEAEEIK